MGPFSIIPSGSAEKIQPFLLLEFYRAPLKRLSTIIFIQPYRAQTAANHQKELYTPPPPQVVSLVGLSTPPTGSPFAPILHLEVDKTTRIPLRSQRNFIMATRQQHTTNDQRKKSIGDMPADVFMGMLKSMFGVAKNGVIRISGKGVQTGLWPSMKLLLPAGRYCK